MPTNDHHPRDDRMIKVMLRNPDGHIEGVWAEQVSRDTAVLYNIPGLTPGWGYGDLVRFNRKRIAVERIMAQTETEYLSYSREGTDLEVTRRYQTMAAYFRRQGIEVEGMIAGAACAARPVEMTEDEFARICEGCPVVLLEEDEDC